ncbi:MAG TPA: peptidylprolyl isomerase [Acidovorax sp.]|jgi:hypothetical protein|nr:peptidylprolyl isomerase [Acidovorax sp.]
MLMKQNWKWVRNVIAALGVAAVGVAVAGPENVVLVRMYKSEVITEKDLSEFLERRVDMRQAGRNLWGVQTALREMALGRALVLEGEALKVPRITGKEASRFDDIYSHTVYKKLAPACDPPADEAAARQFFDDNPAGFRVPPMARLSRIMLPAKEIVAGEPAMGWLFQQAQAISKGVRKFDDVAAVAAGIHKLDTQGDLGWVTLTDDAAILKALADAAPGDLVGPVRDGEFGYLFQVIQKREPRQLTWDEAASTAPSRVVRYCREQANAQLEDRLFKKYGVTLEHEAIRGLFHRFDAKK